MEIQPIHGIPAIRVENTLVIGDMHIGVETHLMKKGYHIPSKTSDMYNAIIDASTNCDHLIVIGDVKDSVPGSSKQEFREIPDFFEKMVEKFEEVSIVRGNHDTDIEDFLPSEVRILPATGVKIHNIGLIHGHTWPSPDVMNSKVLIMAHNHPTVMFVDGVGRRLAEPCWLRGKFKQNVSSKFLTVPDEFIVVPAFNRMLGGSPVNVIGEKMLGPILNSELVDLDDAHIYLLDGIDLGIRKDLLVKGKEYGKFKR